VFKYPVKDKLVVYFTIYGYNIRKGLTCCKHASPADCLTERLARIEVIRNNRSPC